MNHWQNEPFFIEVQKGDRKTFCNCDKTKDGPFCDGSHKGTGIAPTVVTFEEDRTAIICGCGKSGRRPYCDGSHSRG